MVAVAVALLSGCQPRTAVVVGKEAVVVGKEVAGVHPPPVLPKIEVPPELPRPGSPSELPKVGVPPVVPTTGSLDQLLTRLEKGNPEEQMVKFAACTAMRKSTDSKPTAQQWRSRIYTAAPALTAGNLRRAVVDKVVERVAVALSATRDYGATYARVCKF
ncbi:hypothetical protein ACNO8X_10365 [Mycobacterium sp. PDNC021]|uniref:hypothetical protein n=1 Tax=Mycobacterium sp. PDNC021 TaxID=3391399 RepID=UPI003AAE5D2E